MTEFLNDWGITAMVFLPLVGALIMMITPADQEETHKGIALLTTLATAVIGVLLFADFDFNDSGTLQFVTDHSWIDIVNARYTVGIDGMSLPLIALTLLVVPLVIIYSWDHIPAPGNPKSFLILILVLHTGMLGSFVAQDLVLFFVFFEVVLLPMYFMIGVWGGEKRLYAAIKFFLFTLFGSALMLVSFLALYWLTGSQTFNMVGLAEEVAKGDISQPGAVAHLRRHVQWASASRSRCSRSTPGCPTPTPRPQPRVRSSWPPSS
ncbi:MAG: proton-conducting transporter membrane subunit [Acidimicrobiales bacterium]